MSEQINPATGLENNTKPAPIILKKSDLNVNANLTEAKISPMRELLKPVDLADTISDSADSKFVQAVVPSDFLSNDNQEIFDKYSSNVESAKNSYLKQLDDEQNLLESTAAGVGKFVGKVATGVPLGILGTAWGILTLDLVNENVFDRLYDSAREGLDKALPVYSDNPNYHNLGFFDKLFTEPGKLLGDEVGDALAFSTSAILTEVIMSMATAATFGAAAPAQAAASVKLASRGAKLFNGIKNGKSIFKTAQVADKVADITKSLDAANDIAKVQNFYQKSIGTTSGLLFGSSLEARLEARGAQEQYVGQQVENFKNEFGFDPTKEQIANFEKESESVMWATYGLNMAILSTSMMAQHTNLVFKGFQGSKKLKTVSDQIESTAGKLALKDPNKYVKYATLAVKNPLTESLEEFSQGVVSNTAVEYFTNTYHPKANIESLNFLETAGKNAVEYFNSTEGGNSIGIGFLVGALGMPLPKKLGGLSGGIYGDINAYNKSREEAKKIIEQINSQGSFSDMFKENYKNMVSHNLASNKMADSSDANDAFEFKNAENDDLFSYVYNRTSLGFNTDLIEEVDAMKKMSLEQFNQEYGIKEVSEFKTEEEKNKQIAKVENLIKDVNKYSEAVDNIIEANKLDGKVAEQVKPFIVHAASTLKNLDVREEELTTKLNELVGITKQDIDSFESRSKTLPILAKLSGLARKEKAGKLTEEQKELKKELLKNSKENEDIYNSLIAAEKIPSIEELANTYRPTIGIDANGRIDNSVDMTEFMNAASKKLDAVSGKADAKINRQEAEQLLQDVAKIKNRRETFSIYYDFLTTKQGAEALSKAADLLKENLAKDIQEDIDKKAEDLNDKAQDEADLSFVAEVSADASDEAKQNIRRTNANKAKQASKNNNTPFTKNSLREDIEKRWNTNRNNTEGIALFNAEKEAFAEEFAGKYGLPSKEELLNPKLSGSIFRGHIYKSLDMAANEDFENAVINFFNKKIAESATETTSDILESLTEDEDVPSMSTIEETPDGVLPNYQPMSSEPDAYRSQHSDYKLVYDKNSKSWRIEHKDGAPIPSENFGKVEFKYTNENLKPGDKVSIEIRLEDTFADTEYNKQNKLNSKNLLLVFVHTDTNGNKHIVSTVPAYQDNLVTAENSKSYESLKSMREQAFNKLRADGYLDEENNLTPKGEQNKGNLIPTNYSSVVDTILPGRKVFVGELKPANEVFKNYPNAVIGITRETTEGVQIFFDNSKEAPRPVSINSKPGQVFVLIQENNVSYPIRVLTRQLTAEEVTQAEQILTLMSNIDLSTNEGKDELTTTRNILNKLVYFTKEQLIEAISDSNKMDELKANLPTRHAQISKYDINKGENNKEILKRLNSNMQPSNAAKNFVVNGYNLNNTSNTRSSRRGVSNIPGVVDNEIFDEETPVAETQTTNQSNTESKKADIERRRQEELKGEDYRVAVSEEIFEGDDIDNEGEKIRLKIVTNKDGSRTLFIGSKGNLFGEGQGESWKAIDKIGKDNTLTNSEYINAAWKGVGENFNTEGSNSVNKTLKSVEAINAKYDAELKALESTEAKPEAKHINTINKTLETIKEKLNLLNNKKFIVNPKDSNTYIEVDKNGNQIGNIVYDRVSTLNGKKEFTNSEAADRGTIIDTMLREFISGNIKSVKDLITLYESIDKGSSKTFEEPFINDLFNIFKLIEKETSNFEIISTIPTLWGTINNKNIAGTIDLLAIDKTSGKVFIIDLKTSTLNRRKEYDSEDVYDYKKSDSTQQSAYAELLAQQTGIVISGIYLLPIQVNRGATYFKATANQNEKTNKFTLSAVTNTSIFDSNKWSKSLESDTTEATPKSNPTKVGNPIKPEEGKRGFRKFKLKNGNNKTVLDSNKALEWLSKILPEVPVSVLKDGIKILNEQGQEAWGVFKESGIEFMENAPKGVPYHEAFHAIFDLYLSEDVKIKLLTEAQTKTGFSEDLDLEEWLADKFAEYVLTKVEDKTLGSRILEFFKNLLKMLKVLPNNKLDNMFKEISQGVYTSTNKTVTQSKYKSKLNLSVNQYYNRVNMLSDYFVRILNGQMNANPEMSVKNILNNYQYTTQLVKNDISGTTAEFTDTMTFTGVKGIFADVYDNLIDEYNDISAVAKQKPDSKAPYAAEQMAILINNFWVEVDGEYQPSDLIIDAAANLNKYHIKVNLKRNTVAEEVVESEELANEDGQVDLDESESIDGWIINSAKISIGDSASWVLKYELSNLVVADGRDDIGYSTIYDGDTILRTLKRELSNKVTIKEIKDHLKANKVAKPYYKDILDLMSTNKQFEAALVSALTTITVHSRLLKKNIDKDGNIDYVTIDTHSKDTSELLLDDWAINFNLVLKNTVELGKERINNSTTYKLTKAKDSLEEFTNSINKSINTLSNIADENGLTAETSKKISKLLTPFGIIITPNKIKSIFDNEYFKAIEEAEEKGEYISLNNNIKANPLIKHLNESVMYIANKLITFSETYDPASPALERNPFKTEKTTISPFAKLVSIVTEEIYEGSYTTADGEKRMVNTVPNFIAQLIIKLKGNKNKIFQKYLKDPFYLNNLWLNEFIKGENGMLEYQEVGGISEEGKGRTYFNLSPRDKMLTSLLNFYGNTNSTSETSYAWYEAPILADMGKLPLIKFKKYTQAEVIEHLTKVYEQETLRIERVKKEQSKLSDNDLIEFYHYGYDSNGTKDKSLARGLKRHDLPISEGTSLKESIKQYLDAEVARYTEEVKTLGVDKAADKVKYTSAEFISSFVYNDFLAKINMNQLFNGDSAFYKSDTDLSKRASQGGKPGSPLSTSNIPATYKTVIFKNEIVDVSQDYTNIVNKLAPGAKKSALKALAGIDRADAQGFISIERWKDIIDGQGLFKGEYVTAYEKAKKGETLNANELSLVMQPIKPFYYEMKTIGNKIVPTQNKNSEYVILPSLRGSNKNLDTILDLFDNGIQSVQFHSAVKVGAHKIQDLNTIKPSEIENSYIELSNDSYRIQTNVPEHHMDTTVLFGTQIRKLIISNLKDTSINGTYKINGKQYTRSELLKLYIDTINQNLIADSKELDEFFKTNEKLVDLLSEEVRDRGLAKKYLTALNLDSQGEFVFPLFFPITSKKAESLMSSLFANRITKQKIKGGSFVQVSDIISSKELRVVKDDNGSIIEMEALMPWTSAKYMPLDKDGNVDIDYIMKHTPELLEAVGFRIPTEDKYSMPVIKIVGFLPQHSGGTIMLPADFIALSGSDFDVDKLFVMLKEFKSTNSYLRKEYELKDYQINQLRNGELYIKGASEFIKGKGSHYTVESGSATRESRNNLLIDIIKGVLQDPYHAKEIANPGSFERYKELKKVITQLSGQKSDDTFNINLPTNQLELFKRNTAGKALIGIFANHNVNHALMQHMGVSVKSTDADGNVKSFTFTNDDKTYILNGKTTAETDGEYTSRFLAELLAAAVDNAKDPVLSTLNINTYTSDFLAYLLRTGLSPEMAILFLNQPVIKTITNYYFNNNSDNRGTNRLIRELSENSKNSIKENLSAQGLSKEELVNNIKNIDRETEASVLAMFVEMLPASKKLGKITQAMRADAKPSKSMAANRLFLKEYDELPEELRSPYSDISMVHYFTELGIRKANETLSKYFPWINDTFTSVKDALTLNKGFDLTEQEEEFVNQELISFISKDYELFNITQEDKTELLKNTIGDVTLALATEELNNNKFLNALSKIEVEGSTGRKFTILGVDNFNTYSEIQKEAIENSFLELYDINKELALKLIQYVYTIGGTKYTRHSFLQLLPIEVFTKIKDSNGITYQDFLKEAVNKDIDLGNFLDVFYRHYSEDLTFTKVINDYEISTSKMDNTGTYIYFSVDINKNPNLEFVEYVKAPNGVLYKAFMEQNGNSYFRPIPKLGKKGLIYEPNANESFVASNDVVIEKSVKGDLYESSTGKYLAEKVGEKVRVYSVDKSWQPTEIGTFNTVEEATNEELKFKQTNKLLTLTDVIYEDNFKEYYDKYIAPEFTSNINNDTDNLDITDLDDNFVESNNLTAQEKDELDMKAQYERLMDYEGRKESFPLTNEGLILNAIKGIKFKKDNLERETGGKGNQDFPTYWYKNDSKITIESMAEDIVDDGIVTNLTDSEVRNIIITIISYGKPLNYENYMIGEKPIIGVNKLTNQDIENLFIEYGEQINLNLKMKDGLFAEDITLEDFKQLSETVNTKKELEEFIKKCYSL